MKKITVATDVRQKHLSNVYESEVSAKENADMGYKPKFIDEIDGHLVHAWMNHSKHGYQEDSVENVN